jgi:N-acetylmuramoyl-L-alanine amidase
MYLLCTLIFGFIAPIVAIPVSVLPVEQVIPDVNVVAGRFLEANSESGVHSFTKDTGEFFTVFNLSMIIYLIGVLFLMLRSALSLKLILRVKKSGIETRDTSPKVIITREAMSFSFVNTIVLHESASHPVFLHEKSHVIGKHWFDLFIAEIACIFCWMNPMVWLYRKSIKQQHEYLADDYVLNQGVSREEYLMCLFNSLSCQDTVGPVHQFNSQSLKQRIFMITKEKCLRYPKAVYMLIVPILAFIFLSFSGTKEVNGPADVAKVFIIDPGHGGDDAGATSSTGMTEKAIVLSLARLVHEIGKARGLNIILTRASDQTLSIQERLAFSSKAHADVFLSLHLGFDETRAHNGFGIFVSDENIKFVESKKIASVLTKDFSEIKGLSSSRKVANFNALLLKQNPIASAIVEVGCLSDERDAEFVSEPGNQRMIAEAIVSALMKY